MADNTNLPELVVENLKCDLCHGYLSVPPITTYKDSQACGRCSPDWPRNTIYEHLAQFFNFPCMYCDQILPWSTVAKHETTCQQNKILCPPTRHNKFNNRGEYHKKCQSRRITCPFHFCQDQYQVAEVLAHFEQYHKEYIFAGEVAARKILKEEKVWNFQPDTQVCLIVHNQMALVLFVHSCCQFDDTTGNINTYDYQFGVFSLCVATSTVRYSASLTSQSANEEATMTMKNQEIKPYNDAVHSVNYLRMGLGDLNSFDFMTTKFSDIKRLQDLKLSYCVKIAANTEKSSQNQHQQITPVDTEILRETFECPICKDYMYPPVFNCFTGHTVCKHCKTKLRYCPFCKATIGTSRNFVLEEILEVMLVSCRNDVKGCKFVGGIGDVKVHEVSCDYN